MYNKWSSITSSKFPEPEFEKKESALQTLSEVIQTSSKTLTGADLPGFMYRRNDFDIEYDDSAELIIADLELNDDDSNEERAIKLNCMRNLTERLKRRELVKDFTNKFGFTKIQQQMDLCRSRTAEELDLIGKMRPLERFFDSPEGFYAFVQSALYEKRLEMRLTQLGVGKPDTKMDPDTNLSSDTKGLEGEESKPLTRSRSLIDTSRKSKVTEQEVKRISDIVKSDTILTGMKEVIGEDEVAVIGSVRVDPNQFALAKGTVLRCLQNSGYNTANISLKSLGNVLEVGVCGEMVIEGTLKIES